MAIPFSRYLVDQKIIRHPQNPTNPLVSVVMPTYKLRGEMNRRAMDSVLNQTFRDFEFIMVDDGSLDGLHDLLQEYQQRDPRIVLVRHEINSGLPALRTDEGILLARGKYIGYMFEDDCWLPGALENLVATAEKINQDCLVYGAVEHTLHVQGAVVTRSLGAWDFHYGDLKHHNQIANCAVLHTRSAMDRCGMYDPDILIRRLSDYDLWLRLAKEIPFVRCHQVVGRVESGTKYALETSVDSDMALSYRYMSTERNDLLHPDRICQYEVDRLPFATTHEDEYRIREHYIVPYWVQHAPLLTPSERKLALATRRTLNRVLVTKGAYSTSIDVSLGNFAKILPSAVHSQAFFPAEFLDLVKLINFDTVVFHKTLETISLTFQHRVRAHQKTNIYLMDDNLLKFGTGYSASEFSYLRPGETRYNTLVQEIPMADLVLSYAKKITEDVQEYNPRVVEMPTNIREGYILNQQPIPGGKSTGRRLKYAVLTGPIRRRELQALWKQFKTFFSSHKDEVEFHLWGINPAEFEALECPVYWRGFENSYEKYLAAASAEKFDFLICPLFDDHDVKVSKSPIKYLEGTAAGAVGIFSDVITYQEIVDGVSGIKTGNEDWLQALERSFQMPDEDRAAMYAAAKSHILNVFTTESQILRFLTIFEAADLHNHLRSSETKNGRARIAYFFHESILGGATIHLLRHALIAKEYGFEPVLCFISRKPVDEGMLKLIERNNLEYVQLDFSTYAWQWQINSAAVEKANHIVSWMKEQDIRMVHMVTYSAEIIFAASKHGIPYIGTLHQHYDTPGEYQIDEFLLAEQPRISALHSSSLRYAWKWGSVLNIPAFCIRAPIADAYFCEYETRLQKQMPEIPTLLVSGTLQPRKRQLEAIRAVKILKKNGIRVNLVLLGYDHLKQDYVDRCREEVQKLGLEDQVTIPGFALDPKEYYDRADFIFCSSDDESMPQSILKAMASGMRIITTPVGGVKELVLDGFSGIVTDGFEPEDLANAVQRALSLPEDTWNLMVENAHLTAQMSCSEEVVRYQLLKVYNAGFQEFISQGGKSSGDENALAARLISNIQMKARLNQSAEEGIIPRRLSILGLTYRVRIQNDYLNALVLSFGTHTRRFTEKVELTIRSAEFPFRVLRQVVVDGTEIPDNEPFAIYFAAMEDSGGKDLLVTVRVKSFSVRPWLSVYEKGRRYQGLRKYLNAIDARGGQLFGNLMFTPPVIEKGDQ